MQIIEYLSSIASATNDENQIPPDFSIDAADEAHDRNAGTSSLDTIFATAGKPWDALKYLRKNCLIRRSKRALQGLKRKPKTDGTIDCDWEKHQTMIQSLQCQCGNANN